MDKSWAAYQERGLGEITKRNNSWVCVRGRVCDLVVGTAQWYWQRIHSSDHGLHGCDNILEHQLRESFPVFLGVAGAVNDAHLFNKGTLPALTCTWRWNRNEGHMRRMLSTHLFVFPSTPVYCSIMSPRRGWVPLAPLKVSSSWHLRKIFHSTVFSEWFIS